MRKDKLFSWQTLLLLLCGIAINIAGAQLALWIELPLFLDSAGTVLVAALGGIIPGVIVGFVTNALNSLSDPITLYYGVLNVLIAIAAGVLSKRGWFTRLKRLFLPVLSFAFIGGVLGSFVTWMLYGLSIGEGISAGFAVFLYENTHLGEFFSQFIADIAIDIGDKLVTVLAVFITLKLLPDKLYALFPHGDIYIESNAGKKQSQKLFGKRRYISIGEKMTILIVASSMLIGTVGFAISYRVYRESADRRYVDAGTVAANLMSDIVDADLVYMFLRNQQSAGYIYTEERLYKLKESLPIVKYMYVYSIEEGGCRVVFDLDVEGTEASPPGTLIEFEDDFMQYVPALLNGEQIEPVISNGSYGWLLTVYKPLIDDKGHTTAYACADIAMDTVISDRYIYIIRTVSLLFGALIILVSFALWYVRRKVVAPLNRLTEATSRLAYDSDAERQQNTDNLRQLDIRTGDEIENLYLAISKTTSDVSDYLTLINTQNREAAKKAKYIEELQNNIIISFANMVEMRDECTGIHIKRTSLYVREIGTSMQQLGMYPEILTDEYLKNLERSAPLHDIGKIRVPDQILCKPGRLTPEEFEVIKLHSEAGRQIIADVLSGIEGDNYLSQAMDMAYAHHERWDGGGYPRGISGKDIPLCARIMAVADVFDALISVRSYKPAYSFERAVEIIRENSGTQFDPDVVTAFLAIEDEIRAVSGQ